MHCPLLSRGDKLFHLTKRLAVIGFPFRVSIHSPFPSSFGDDIESSPSEEGASKRDTKIEVVILKDVEDVGIDVVRPVEDFSEAPRSRMDGGVTRCFLPWPPSQSWTEGLSLFPKLPFCFYLYRVLMIWRHGSW